MTLESIRKRLDDIGGTQIIQGLVNSIRDLGFILNVLRNHYNKTHQNYFTIILTITYIQRNIDYWTFYLWRNVTCSHRTETLSWQFFLFVFYWPWDQVPDHPLKSKGTPAKCFETPLTVSCPLSKPRNKTRRDISIYTQQVLAAHCPSDLLFPLPTKWSPTSRWRLLNLWVDPFQRNWVHI